EEGDLFSPEARVGERGEQRARGPRRRMNHRETRGWRPASAIIGFAIITIVLPLVALVIRLRPEEMGQLPDGRLPGDTGPPVRSTDHGTGENSRPGAVLASATFWPLSVALGVYTVRAPIVRVFGSALLQPK